MKKMNKILAVLLSVAMLCGLIPAFAAATVSAAGVGTISNGDFETGDFNSWDYYEYSTSISTDQKNGGTYSARISAASSVAGRVALEQIVPVNTGETYTLTFYNKRTNYSGACAFNVSVELGNSSSSFTNKVVDGSTVSVSRSWAKRTVSFTTTTYKYARIRFNALGSGADTWVDDIVLTPAGTGNTNTHAKPSLTSFSTVYNWPKSAGGDDESPSASTNNVIKEPGFEATSGAQWNADSFLTNGVSVQKDASIARSGEHYLKYYRGTTAPAKWSMFEVTLPSTGDYVFSAWVRTPNLSAENQGKASIGIIDTDTDKFLTYEFAHYSTPEIQIRSTATDDKWHLRSVTFYGLAGSTIKIGMYGLKSTMYVDDISIHLLANGTTYVGDQKGSITNTVSNSVSKAYCSSEDNLIADGGMNDEASVDFWTKAASGWNNGFLEFASDPNAAGRGKTLHFKGTTTVNSNKRYRYIKFVYVEPNTEYTVSFDYRLVTKGSELMFIDNNIEKNVTFCQPNLTANNSWNTFSFTFSTGNYNRIGIVFQNGAGEAYYDDFRFFKNADGIAEKPEEDIVLKNSYHGASRMEMGENNKLGLAFLFQLKATDVAVNANYIGDYSNGKVKPYGIYASEYKLIAAGALITNNEVVGQDPDQFVRANATNNRVIDVNARCLFDDEYKSLSGVGDADSIVYGVRITNIPENHKFTDIFARPYYIFEDNDGNQITVYGDIHFDSYEAKNDINDGSFGEWG